MRFYLVWFDYFQKAGEVVESWLTRKLRSQTGLDIHISVYCSVELMDVKQMPFLLVLSPHNQFLSPANPRVFVPADDVASLPLIGGVPLNGITTQTLTIVHCSSHYSVICNRWFKWSSKHLLERGKEELLYC